MVAPYSGDIFAIVALSANDSEASPGPVIPKKLNEPHAEKTWFLLF